jgi:8-oxo-dGTP pyrophosphatase MutT (NUDIX family)
MLSDPGDASPRRAAPAVVLEESAAMEWKVGPQEKLYRDDWLDIRIADVELPDGKHIQHRLVRTSPGAGVVVVDRDQQVLLLWRHRFITETWGWEIPIGKIEGNEDPVDAAARECEEETGWRPGPLRHLIDVRPTPGLSTSRHHIFRADVATYIGEADMCETDRVEWRPLADVRMLIEKAEITSGTTIAALLYVLTAPSSRG